MLATPVHLHHALNEGLLCESAIGNGAESAIRHAADQSGATHTDMQ